MKKVVLIIAVAFLLTACSTVPVETATLLPSTTPTKTKFPIMGVTYYPSPIPSTKTFTPGPTFTPYSTQTYYDSEYNFTMDYPAHWEQVEEREFRGEEGSLKVSELEGYASIWPHHVHMDYLYKTYFDKEDIYLNISQVLRWGFLIKGISDSDKILVFEPYKIDNNGLGYLLFEFDIAWKYIPYIILPTLGSLVFDFEVSPTPTLSSPTPNPRAMSMEYGIKIQEYFAGIAFINTNWLGWDFESIDSSFISKYDYQRYEYCGSELSIGGDHYEIYEEDNYIHVEKNGELIFLFKVSVATYPSFGNLCSWQESWFLQTDGFIIQDGKILNYEYGYEEMFGMSFHGDRFNYFFVKNGQTYVSIGGEALPLTYDYVEHNTCCGGTGLDIHGNDEMIWFYGVHDDAWYFVEVSLSE